jgi:hypothetical protein
LLGYPPYPGNEYLFDIVIRVQFAKKAVENMEKSTLFGLKDGKIKYKTQNLDIPGKA